MARFYVDGIELDIGDPQFYLSFKKSLEIKENIENYIEDTFIEEKYYTPS